MRFTTFTALALGVVLVGTFDNSNAEIEKHSSSDAEPDNVVTIEGGRFNVKLPPMVRSCSANKARRLPHLEL